MKTSDLLSMSSLDVSKLTRSELAKATRQLADIANKRLKRLETAEAGINSPLYQKTMETGYFRTGGKNQGQLQAEFQRARSFLNKKTSTVSGWRKMRTKTLKRIGVPEEDQKSFDDKSFWQTYRRLEKNNRALVHAYGSTETQRLLRKYMTEGKGDFMETVNALENGELDLEDLEAELYQRYEAQQEEEGYSNDFIDVSDEYDEEDIFD